MARFDDQCTDRLNHRHNTYHNRQVHRLDLKAGESPPPIKNISQTQSRVKSMILKLGVFLVVVGIVKLCIALVLRAREKRGKV